MARRRVLRMVRATTLVGVLGGAALALAACTLSAPNPARIPVGTSTGEPLGRITFTFTYTADVLTETVDVQLSIETGSGSVTLTATADSTLRPRGTGSAVVNGSCTPSGTLTVLVCTDVYDVRTGTLSFAGLKVNSVGASGKLFARVSDTTFSTQVLVASYGTGTSATGTGTTGNMGTVQPTIHSAPKTTFSAGVHSSFWVRVHGGPAVLSLVGAPSWLRILRSGYLEGTPPASAVGTRTFKILASTDPRTTHKHGDDLTATQTFTLTVVRP